MAPVSLYAQYITERTHKQVLEKPHGFAVYYYVQAGVYIEEIFVEAEYRRSKLGTEMADEIAKEAKSKGLNQVFGSVHIPTKGSTTSMKVLLASGFQLVSAANDFITLSKEI